MCKKQDLTLTASGARPDPHCFRRRASSRTTDVRSGRSTRLRGYPVDHAEIHRNFLRPPHAASPEARSSPLNGALFTMAFYSAGRLLMGLWGQIFILDIALLPLLRGKAAGSALDKGQTDV